MKEIRTIKMVEQTEIRFIADDGTEFIGENAERECGAYERQKNKERVNYEFEKLNAKKIDFPLLSWCACDAELWNITLNSKRDYFSIVDYFAVNSSYFDNSVDIPTEFPYNITIYYNDGYMCEYTKDIKTELIKVLSALEG